MCLPNRLPGDAGTAGNKALEVLSSSLQERTHGEGFIFSILRMRKQKVPEVRQLVPGHGADTKPSQGSFCGTLAKRRIWGKQAEQDRQE